MYPRRFARVRPTGRISDKAKLIVDPKAPVIDCRIVDYSPGGACLELSGQTKVRSDSSCCSAPPGSVAAWSGPRGGASEWLSDNARLTRIASTPDQVRRRLSRENAVAFSCCAGSRWSRSPRRRCGSRRRAWRRFAPDACPPSSGLGPGSARCRDWSFPWRATPELRPPAVVSPELAGEFRGQVGAEFLGEPQQEFVGAELAHILQPQLLVVGERRHRRRLWLRSCPSVPVRAIAAWARAAPAHHWRWPADWPTAAFAPAASPT